MTKNEHTIDTAKGELFECLPSGKKYTCMIQYPGTRKQSKQMGPFSAIVLFNATTPLPKKGPVTVPPEWSGHEISCTAIIEPKDIASYYMKGPTFLCQSLTDLKREAAKIGPYLLI